MFSFCESFCFGVAYDGFFCLPAYSLAAFRAFEEPCCFDGVADERVESGAADVLWYEVESYGVAAHAASVVYHASSSFGTSFNSVNGNAFVQ